MTICNCDEFNTDVTFSGNIKLGGAIAKINDRANVGITSNSFDDLIHNFDGTAYWFSGTQGGGSEGSLGDQVMKLNTEGDLDSYPEPWQGSGAGQSGDNLERLR